MPHPLHLVRFDPPFNTVHSSAISSNQVPFFFVIHLPFTGFLVWNTAYRIDYVLNTFYFCHTPQGVLSPYLFATLSPGMFSLVQFNKYVVLKK